MLDAERKEKAALAQQLDELRADAAERARLTEELIAANSRQVDERSAADGELKAASANLDLLAGQLKERDIALEASSSKLDLLARQIKEREIDLHTARAESSRLTCEQQTAADELMALQMTLAGRDSALRDQSDELGAQVESYRRALERAEHVHADMITSLEAKLAAQAERFSMLQDEHRSTQESCKQFQGRELELTETQKQLETAHQSMLDAERMEKAALAQQLDELRADAAERARLAEELIAANSRQVGERSAADAELKATSANLDLLAGQLKEREIALEASSTKLDLLARQIKEREIDLHTARAECSRLTCEQQTAADELKALQMTLAGRDSALRDQSDELGAQVESYRRALEHAEHVHKDMITSLEAKLAAQAERFSMLQDEHRSTQESCKQFQDRELELTETQKRLETAHQSMLDAERMEKAALAQQLDERLADAAEGARLAEELIAANSRHAEERSAADAELKAASANLDLLAGQLKEREIALEASSTKLDLLARQIKEREIDLHTALAECSRLTCEQQTAADELKALKITLAGRDSALRDQSEELGAQVESHRRALEHAEHVHKDIITSLEAKLAAQAERFSMLQDEHRSTQESCKQFQDRELELTEAQKRLETAHQSMLDAERMEKAALAQQVDELRPDAAERARLAEELIAANSRQVEERSAADAELKAASSQIRELNRLLSESERLNRETVAVLNESGVRFHAPVSN
jgi:chromosome segregation ATPase